MTPQSKRGIWLVAGVFTLGLAALGGLFLSARLFGSVRDLPHGYRLELLEGKYFVLAPQTDGSPGGVFQGTIEQIGWDDRFVLAKVRRIARIDPDGWYVLDTTTRQVKGPIPESELSADPILSRIPRKPDALKGM